jgi:hypothetical protein
MMQAEPRRNPPVYFAARLTPRERVVKFIKACGGFITRHVLALVLLIGFPGIVLFTDWQLRYAWVLFGFLTTFAGLIRFARYGVRLRIDFVPPWLVACVWWAFWISLTGAGVWFVFGRGPEPNFDELANTRFYLEFNRFQRLFFGLLKQRW